MAGRPRPPGGRAGGARFIPQVIHARNVLARQGFRFCDSDDAEVEADRDMWLAAEDKAEAVMARCQALPWAEGVAASSTDHPDQSVSHAMTDDDAFWSSTGSLLPTDDEWVLLRLHGPSHLRAIRVAVYRATYQHGSPIFPPASISIHIGPACWQLSPAILHAPVRLTEDYQTFMLPANTPLGHYVKVTLHAKRQMQLQDSRYYIAVRHVAAYGHTLTISQLRYMRRLALCPRSHLTHGRTVPATELAAAAGGGALPGRRQGGTYRSGQVINIYEGQQQ